MAVDYANTKMVTKALLSLDFFVVADLFMTPTSELADILLPAATWLERNAVSDHLQASYNNVHLQQKVVEIEGRRDDRALRGMPHGIGQAPAPL